MKKNNQVVEAKMKVPRILCEIFVYGTEDEKQKLKNLLDDLQIQMNKARRNRNKLRVCFYIDKGELSVQEKLEWFSKEGKCKYFKVLNADSKIDKNFIRDVLGKIRNFENSLSSLKKSNIKILGLKEKKEDEIEEAKILDINL
jgi:hypothetical protein